MKNVLLTGATGFVGKQLLKLLLESSFQIVPVVRVGKGSEFKKFSNVKHVVESQDIFSESADWWERQCEGIDLVIHAAWHAQPGSYLSSPLNIDCLVGTLALARGALRAKVKRFIGVGTCFEYDLSVCRMSIDSPLKPSSLYGATKASAFQVLNSWLLTENMEFAWCRLFYLFGEGEDPRKLVQYVRNCIEKNEIVHLTDGNQIRDYLDVTEAARQIIELANSSQVGPINICSGKPITVRQIVENVADEYGRRDLLRFGVRLSNKVDPDCIVGVLKDDPSY